MDDTTPPSDRHAAPFARPDTETTTTAMVARTPEDLIAFVPLAVGFTPHRSVVMLTFGGPRPFHARVDLPPDPDGAEDLALALLGPALKHEVRAVVFVVYDDDTPVADASAWTLVETFRAGGVDVIEALRVHEDRWFGAMPGRAGEDQGGTAFDTSTHPFTVQGVVDGRVTRASREELRATLAPDRDAIERVLACLGEARALDAGDLGRLVASCTSARRPFSDLELAAVALAIVQEGGRDAVWRALPRSAARAAVDLWSDAVRRLPDAHAASAAAVLAVVAWVAGEGALAWCAVDRCRAVHPDHPLADLVAHLLDSATSPDVWETLRAAAGLEQPAA